MILQALVDYYEALAAQGKIAKPGWCQAKISFALDIDGEGNLKGIIDLRERATRGKKEIFVPRNMILPEGENRAGTKPNAQFLWDNAKYILGIDTPENILKAKECFLSTAEKCNKVLENVSSYNAVALKSFFNKWNPEDAKEYNNIKDSYADLLGNVNLTIYVNSEEIIPKDKDVIDAWERYKNNSVNDNTNYCLVTGKKSNIARLHPKIKGIMGAQSAGASLVAFNAPAYESYGHEQGLNAPVSEYAAFAYTTALNKLLADENHHQVIGGTTIVYWAEGANDACASIFGGFLTQNNVIDDKDLNDFFKNLREKKQVDYQGLPVKAENKFYILGISPNAARLSVRFFLADTFGHFVENVAKYYDEFAIVHSSRENEHLPLWQILQETANKNGKDKSASPLLGGAVLRSILTDSPYPEALYQNIILRAKADQDNPDKFITKISRIKAAVIKAVLKRNHKNKEVTTVALNEESKSQAYVLGRLFAVLEFIQKEAGNSGIKERYFNSASSTPGSIFPILLKLKNHHVKKIQASEGIGNVIYWEKQIGNILEEIDNFPVRLSLQEQGEFILGYYHQIQYQYTKKEEK